jgi:hypothetical protein
MFYINIQLKLVKVKTNIHYSSIAVEVDYNVLDVTFKWDKNSLDLLAEVK